MHAKLIETASAILRQRHPRAEYAQDVLFGRQRWSGSDLKGKARKLSGGYYWQRLLAESALHQAGGIFVFDGSGLKVSAVYLGMDDYGSALYETGGGVCMARGFRVYPVR